MPRVTASRIESASTTGTTPVSALRTSGRASPMATTPRPRAASGSGEIGKRPAFVAPADDGDDAIEALNRPTSRVDVGGFRIVHEAHSADDRHRLHHVLEAGEAIERARHRFAGRPAACAMAVAAATLLSM